MKIHYGVLFAVLLLTGCVDDKFFGNSSEKKILSFQLEGQVGNASIDQSGRTISLKAGAGANIRALKPTEVILSTFSTLSPSPDEARDFSVPVTYRVTAEDGSTADYVVTAEQEGSEPQVDNSSFNQWYTTPKGYQEPGADANSVWATGNAGVTTLGGANVAPLTISGSDLAARLVTLDLGSLAGLIGQRMGAGSLFTGKFVLDIQNPLNSTIFGIGFSGRPKQFAVDYAYSPGAPYLNKSGQVQAGKTDSCDIYLFLENRAGPEPKRVATGWFRSGEEVISAFKPITVDLTYGPLGTAVPGYQKPANGLYADSADPVTHITVVFSSSYNGAFFEGGTNSTLVVNNLRLIY